MRTIRYEYNSFLSGCECCSDGIYNSVYEIYEDGKQTNFYAGDPVEVCEDEEDLRRHLSHLEPFEVDPDSRWF